MINMIHILASCIYAYLYRTYEVTFGGDFNLVV